MEEKDKVVKGKNHILRQVMRPIRQITKDESRLPLLFYYFITHFYFTIKNELANVNALIIEDNPFYGLSNQKINAVESTTDDNLMNVKLEYAPEAIETGSPEFFKATLYYKDTKERALHADTDIVISKDGNELFKESNEYSKPYVHTPNGIVLSSYKFLDSGQYVISVKVLGLNFMPVNPKQVSFTTNQRYSIR